MHRDAQPSLLTQPQRRRLGLAAALYRRPPIHHRAGEPLRFGLVADPQYADAPPDGERYYRHSPQKLDRAIACFNRQPLAFVATLGDLVDRHWRDYPALLARYRALRHPHLIVSGNHDAVALAAHLAAAQPPLALPKHYYAVTLPGIRLLVLDGNDLSLCAAGDDLRRAQRLLAHLTQRGAPQAQPWNGAVGVSQLTWLHRQLNAARRRAETALVFCHFPLAQETHHSLWNHAAVSQLLCHYRVRACFSGHDHRGGYLRREHTDFITLRGMVDGADASPFAIAELNGTRLTLRGFGPEPSRRLTL
ncbi:MULTISPECIES: metallophosphoesterase [Edwardsiella]|uniref:Twin-arginine translocation pathway signal n=2 Tax=Edwardsiella anguillarum TaxID=1821960 RepID=A0A076LMS5_9GAMM|nr:MULTISPECIES: metallophosphoesterase [Edwardsiella]AKM48538.1 hypothetical protein QY76_15650 [Edwardsiella sp. EA181011]GAJ67800.1 hypothetical protein MA13_contig00007-0108 [Edwardsiella piscicida]AIJ09226.1 Twin-arginine translocation pathway signal [Edwardsiella anguillarum ET080813]KAB0589937.1 hypothetical protein F7P84_12940 [Edwardsiella anguillarum]RFS99674.1 hypothetical protein CGL57_17620 [Edwardsiella anguillarum]